jgi:rhodanese-related sulfurtransferase
MPQQITASVKQMVEEARSEIEEISAEDAIGLLNDDNVVIVDIRDVRELYRDGKIPGALHAPRGMLEFWIAPDSPYHKDIFSQDKKFVFHCASGWRSALATRMARQMGLNPVAHIETGFGGWKEAGGPIEPVEPPNEKKDG